MKADHNSQIPKSKTEESDREQQDSSNSDMTECSSFPHPEISCYSTESHCHEDLARLKRLIAQLKNKITEMGKDNSK